MIDKATHDVQREAAAEEGALQPLSAGHRTRRADITAAQEAAPQPRNLIAIARISQDLKEAIRHSQGWASMPADQLEALEAIACSMALILNGQASRAQAWDEIAEQAISMADRVGRK